MFLIFFLRVPLGISPRCTGLFPRIPPTSFPRILFPEVTLDLPWVFPEFPESWKLNFSVYLRTCSGTDFWKYSEKKNPKVLQSLQVFLLITLFTKKTTSDSDRNSQRNSERNSRRLFGRNVRRYSCRNSWKNCKENAWKYSWKDSQRYSGCRPGRNFRSNYGKIPKVTLGGIPGGNLGGILDDALTIISGGASGAIFVRTL